MKKIQESLIDKMAAIGRKKGELVKNHVDRYFLRTILATVFLTIATNAFLRLGELLTVFDTTFTASKISFSFLFGWTLVIIRYMNTELFTANTMYSFLNVGTRQMKLTTAFRLLIVSYSGNFLGAFLTAAFLVAAGSIFGPFSLDIIQAKLDKPLHLVLMQGIIANFIVCTAVLLANNIRSDGARMSAMVMTIFLFAIIGSEHVIANFALFSLYVFYTPEALSNLSAMGMHTICTTIGNIIGGGVLIGLTYAYLNTGPFVYKD